MSLADRLAGRLAAILAARRAEEPRHPDQRRLPWPGRTLAGVVVTPDNAVTVPAVWAGLRFLSQTVASLPWHVMAETRTGAQRQPSHPVDWLLHKRPNPEWSSFQFRETLTHWALRWGNGPAEIERDAIGRPAALWPVHPERVTPQREAGTGALVFEIANGHGLPPTVLPAADLFVIRGFGEGPWGVNVMHYAAQSIGWARAAQLFGAAFFGNGMNVNGVVEVTKGLEPAGLQRLKAELAALYRGPRNANRTPVLDAGMTWKATQIEPEKGQMLATNEFLVEEICRWLGVPPHKVAHLKNAHFNNVSEQRVEVVVDSVLPWVIRFEDEADAKLFGQNRRALHTKMNLRGLQRGDFKAQQEGLEVMRRNGVINGDEWRDLTEMNPMPAGEGGEKYIVQAQYTELKKAGEAPPAAPADDARPGRRTEPGEDDASPDAATAAMIFDLDAAIAAAAREPAHAA